MLAGATRSAEQGARAEAIARDEGLAMIPPFDHPDVIAGQGTVGLEILEQRPDVRTILVPVSGGGLIAGISAAVAALAPGVRVIGVEPAGRGQAERRARRGSAATLDRTASIADGLLSRSIGTLTFAVLRQIVREAVTGQRGRHRRRRPLPRTATPSSGPSRRAPWPSPPCWRTA